MRSQKKVKNAEKSKRFWKRTCGELRATHIVLTAENAVLRSEQAEMIIKYRELLGKYTRSKIHRFSPRRLFFISVTMFVLAGLIFVASLVV